MHPDVSELHGAQVLMLNWIWHLIFEPSKQTVFLSEISPADAVSLHTRRYLDLLQYVGNIDTLIVRVKTPSGLVGGYCHFRRNIMLPALQSKSLLEVLVCYRVSCYQGYEGSFCYHLQGVRWGSVFLHSNGRNNLEQWGSDF